MTIPRIEGAFSPEWIRLDLGLDPGRRGELPRGDRQRRGHGALLLHPLRVPDLLQERVRGAHRLAVPADPARPDIGTGSNYARGRREHAALRGVLLRAVLHDRLPVARLPRHGHGKRADQLPLPGHARLVPAAVGRDREEAARPVRRAGRQVRRQVRQVHRPGLRAGRGDLDAQEPRRQPAAVRRGRPGLPAAALVRAVLHRRRGHQAGHGRALRVRGGHHPRRWPNGSRRWRRTSAAAGRAAGASAEADGRVDPPADEREAGFRPVDVRAVRRRRRWSPSSARSTRACSGAWNRCAPAPSSAPGRRRASRPRSSTPAPACATASTGPCATAAWTWCRREPPARVPPVAGGGGDQRDRRDFSLVLAVPPELAGTFAYRPGQFLTVRVPHDRDGSVARCYSLSSSPHTGDPHTVTVKRPGTPPAGSPTTWPPAPCWIPCHQPERSLPGHWTPTW